MKLFLFIFLTSFLSSLTFLQAKTVSHRTRNPLGSVSFFLDPKNPPPPGRSVHLNETDQVYFCVRMNREDSRIKEPLRYLRRIELTLEGGNPPQKLIAKTKSWNRLITPDSNDCFVGELKVPKPFPSGKYRLTEIDLWTSDSTSISLREEISEFKPQGVIEIVSSQVDREPPRVERIESKTPLQKKIRFGAERGRERVHFHLFATDSVSGIDPQSIHIFFKMFIDKNLVDILEAKCKSKSRKNPYYDCKLYFSRAEPHLRTRTVELVLDSIILTDRLGNEIVLNQPKELKKLFGGKLLHYIFHPYKESKGKVAGEEEEEERETLPPSQRESPSN